MKNSKNHQTGLSVAEYFSELVTCFPGLSNRIDMSDGPHFNMERFADYTIEQIEKADHAELKRCFDFQEDRIDLLNEGLENAINVSYCETLICYDMPMPFFKNMRPKLFKVYMEYKVFWEDLNS